MVRPRSPSILSRVEGLMIFIVVPFIFFLDQFTKLLAVKNLSLNHSLPLIKGALHLTLIHNRGAAFGILRNQTQLFIFVSILAVILLGAALQNNRYKQYSLHNISLAIILAGALGNLTDRLRLGYVIDFLDFRIWPVFNVADSAITVGAIMLGYCILFKK